MRLYENGRLVDIFDYTSFYRDVGFDIFQD